MRGYSKNQKTTLNRTNPMSCALSAVYAKRKRTTNQNNNTIHFFLSILSNSEPKRQFLINISLGSFRGDWRLDKPDKSAFHVLLLKVDHDSPLRPPPSKCHTASWPGHGFPRPRPIPPRAAGGPSMVHIASMGEIEDLHPHPPAHLASSGVPRNLPDGGTPPAALVFRIFPPPAPPHEYANCNPPAG